MKWPRGASEPQDKDKRPKKEEAKTWDDTLTKVAFVPLALIQEQGTTNLAYLHYGKAKLVRTAGWIGWHPDLGVYRLHVTREKLSLQDPDGRTLRSRRMSSVDRLDRFTYDNASNQALHPTEVEGLKLEAEDMAHPQRFKMFYKDEDRSILSVIGDRVNVKLTSIVSLGGAHPIREASVERVSLINGAELPAEYPMGASVSSAVQHNKNAKKGTCLTEHEGTVALRGPGGAVIPVAILGGALESCRGDIALAWDGVTPNKSKARSLGHGARFQRDAVYLKDVPLADGVVDVVSLNGIEGALIVQGKRFQPATHVKKSKVKRRNKISFLPFDRDDRPARLGKMGPIVSAQSIPVMGLNDQQQIKLWKAFGIRNPERRR